MVPAVKGVGRGRLGAVHLIRGFSGVFFAIPIVFRVLEEGKGP